MAKIKKEVSCIVGQYTNAQGQNKNRYQRIGSIIETKNGEMLKLDVVPLKEGGWDGWAYLNDPKPKDDQPRQQRGSGFDDMDSDLVPF
jgi:hypothetical protein